MKAIAAVSLNGVIGIDDRIPWVYSEDLKYFASKTRGQRVVMGSNTFRSIWFEKVKRETGLSPGQAIAQVGNLQDIEILPGREKIILTTSFIGKRSVEQTHHNHKVVLGPFASGFHLQDYVQTLDGELETWCIGGASLYKLCMPVINEWHISLIPEVISPGPLENTIEFPWEEFNRERFTRVAYQDSRSGMVRFFELHRIRDES